ncbi:MAG: DUF4276 family protein [Thermodesulfobacteriota bacterium]|nr:DUF4276 family protein [Thermodesulfobacteriota bacterium]
MSNCVNIVAIVEGKTEEIFIKDILYPYLATKNIFIIPILVSKPGQKGGDVKFIRVKKDIERHLKQRPDTYLTIFVDFYGIQSDWPGIGDAESISLPKDKAECVNQATMEKVVEHFGEQNADRRFIPYIAMYEFEALLFSDPAILAGKLQIDESQVVSILEECGEPENIDNSPVTAPSKRLESLSSRFKKTTTGIAVLKEIGLTAIREKCPIFDNWVTTLESIPG